MESNYLEIYAEMCAFCSQYAIDFNQFILVVGLVLIAAFILFVVFLAFCIDTAFFFYRQVKRFVRCRLSKTECKP